MRSTEALFSALSLAALFARGFAWNDPHGHSSCPCVIPNQTTWCAGTDRAMHNGSCYPKTYGASTCGSHDANLTTECLSGLPCSGVDGSAKDCSPHPTRWCSSKWCWVDPKFCLLPHSQSTFFSGAVHYSYETCGNLNQYDPDRHELFLQNIADLRISFPGSSGSGYTIVRDGPAGFSGLDVNNGTKRRFGEFGRMGSTVQFFDAVWKEYGRTSYTVVRVSEASEQRYLQSSFTACIHELALNITDACVGNFWPTLERRLLASFTSAIYEDTFHLVAFGAVEENNWFVVWLAPSLLLFSLQEWLALLGFLLYAAIITWLIEGTSNEEEFPQRSISDGIARSMFNHLQCFVGMGDFRYHPHTHFGRIVVLTVSCSMLVAVTSFTANMTVEEFANAQVKVQYRSLDDLIKDNGRVCGLEANRRGFCMRHPGTSPLYDSYADVDEALKAMDSKMCKGVIMTKDEWDQRKKLADHCDKFLIPTTLMSKSNAFAMRDDLVAPFSWAMTKLQNQGVYSQLQTLAQETYVESFPDKCVRNNQENTPTTFLTGPILISTVIVTLTFLVFAVVDTRKASQAEEGDEVFNVPSLRARICGKGRKSSIKISLTEDLCRIHANDSDLKMIGRVFEARHTTEERLRHRVKGDAPLTVADVPMLVFLMKQDTHQTSTETQQTSSDLAKERSSDLLPETQTTETHI